MEDLLLRYLKTLSIFEKFKDGLPARKSFRLVELICKSLEKARFEYNGISFFQFLNS